MHVISGSERQVVLVQVKTSKKFVLWVEGYCLHKVEAGACFLLARREASVRGTAFPSIKTTGKRHSRASKVIK